MRRLIVLALFATLLPTCKSDDERKVIAKQIASRADLIGGPGALGDVGDFLLANEQVRFIVQGEGFSRGFGLYGGSLIDADLQRPEAFGDSSGGNGNDNFSELFPGLFLKAMQPASVTAVTHPDGSAAVEVTGRAADFVFLAKRINEVIITQAGQLRFKNEYRLRPGKRYVEITTTIENQGETIVELPDSGVNSLIGDDLEFPLPVGDVILFGAGNTVFSEIAGFDMRFTLEDLYEEQVSLPQLPGLRTPFLATRGQDVSYGFMSGVTDPNLSFAQRAEYDDAKSDELIVPFLASAFTGAFYASAPKTLSGRVDKYPVCSAPSDCGEFGTCEGGRCKIACDAANPCDAGYNCVEGICDSSAFSYSKYFIVGRGDVASIRDVVHEIRGTTVGRVRGIVRERFAQSPEIGVDVIVFDEAGSPYSQHTTDSTGQFEGTYAPGTYNYRVLADGRFPSTPVSFEVKENETSFLEIEIASPGEVSVRIVDAVGGELIPGKCSLVGVYTANAAGFPARDFLYDLRLGERVRPVDLIPDSADPSTRRYVEEVIIAPAGRAKTFVRPGKYRAVCSRGMEYDTYEQDIEVREREQTMVDAQLTRVVETDGWASGDYHLHAINSVDSFTALDDRVAHVAAEGVDIACSTDHNFVTDYTRAISSLGIERFVQGMVGLEMTPLEIGHFNAFPLRYDAEPITKGSFEWSGRPPQDLFDDLRALGSHGPENTIVQVNHPRDTILGYFNDYNVNPDTGEPDDTLADPLLSAEGPEFGAEKFSWDFDALEVYNGKRYELLRHYRVPEELPPPPIPDDIPPAGTILRDETGQVAFPGGLDDWFLLLNNGRVYTGMGNSDTHSLADEPGIPRTYLPVSEDRPGGIDELEIVRAIKAGNAFATSGPFSRIAAEAEGCSTRLDNQDLGRTTCQMGELAKATNGSLTMVVDTQTAPWIEIDEVRFVVNGETQATVEGDRVTLAKVTHQITGLTNDAWVVVEIEGSKSMFPVIVPNEFPAIQVSDALGSIGAAFGFDLNPFGNLSPSQITLSRPYAFSNPIFIDVDGNGAYDAPNVGTAALRASIGTGVKGKRVQPHEIPELAKIFALFMKGCGHSH